MQIKNNLVFYLAHPYTDNERENYEKSIEIMDELIDMGYIIINLITLAQASFLNLLKGRTNDFWYQYDLKILNKCDGIVLADGWKNSKGCNLEYQYAKKHDKIIYEYKNKQLRLIN